MPLLAFRLSSLHTPTHGRLFGSARKFARTWKNEYGRTLMPDQAAAVVTIYTLVEAIKAGLATCDLGPVLSKAGNASEVDFSLFTASDSGVVCYERGVVVPGLTAYEAIRRALYEIGIDTFFGHVEFNGRRRNQGRAPLVVQVLPKEGPEVVLPMELASAAVELPIPPPEPKFIHTARGERMRAVVCMGGRLCGGCCVLV